MRPVAEVIFVKGKKLCVVRELELDIEEPEMHWQIASNTGEDQNYIAENIFR